MHCQQNIETQEFLSVSIKDL